MRALLPAALLLAACTDPVFVASKVIERSFPAASVSAIAIVNSNGAVDVLGDPAFTSVSLAVVVSVRGCTQLEAQENLRQLSLTETLVNGTLTLQDKIGARVVPERSPRFEFRLRVPPRMALDLNLQAGDIQVLGTDGPIALNTDHGAIVARVTTAKVHASSWGGGVDLQLATAGQVDGDVSASCGPVFLTLGSGVSTTVCASGLRRGIPVSRLRDVSRGKDSISGRVGTGAGLLNVQGSFVDIR